MDPILSSFLLEQVPRLAETLRAQEMGRLYAYLRGTQYDDRPLDAHGYRKSSPSVYGSAVRTPPWSDRDPGATWSLRTEVVRDLTGWILEGDAWCHIEAADDEQTEDWVNTLALLTNASDVLAEARDYGGGLGTAIVSFAVRNGDFFLEAQNPSLCWPLTWADETTHRPSSLVKIYRGDNPLAKSDRDRPLLARYWDSSIEGWYQEQEDKSTGKKFWTTIDEVSHGYGFCPVYWYPQNTRDGRHDGEADGAGGEELIDRANELATAGDTTTLRNADDTLVVKTNPANNPGHVTKGAYNTIFAEGGAEYLSQDGTSAEICLKLAERRAEQFRDRAGIVKLSPEMHAKAASGELLRRLMQPTLKTSGGHRRGYGRGLILPLFRGLLEASRLLRARGLLLNVPPRVNETELGRVVTPRDPGKSMFLELVWPDAFPPSAQDSQLIIQSAVAATGGKAVMSQRTGVEMLKIAAGIPVTNVDQELDLIKDEAEAAAANMAASMGMGPDGQPTGPAEGGGDADPEKGQPGSKAPDKSEKPKKA